MSRACEPGYEAFCGTQEGPYPDDEVTEEVEDFEQYIAAMERSGMEADVEDTEQEVVSESESDAYARALNIVSKLGPQRVAALKNACEIELRRWDERNAIERKQIDAAMGKRTRTGRRTRSDAGSKRAPKDGVAA